LPLDQWQRVLQVNLWGVIAGSVAAYSVMAKQGSGYIVNIASNATSMHNPLFGPYVTSKCGVVGFSRVLSTEAEAFGVQVSVVCPGNIKTDMVNESELAWFTPALPVQEVARRILKGVAQRKRIIVLPFYAKVIAWLDRLSPKLLNPLRRAILRDVRKAKKQQQSTHPA
jgi:short-subunit dehydrogenase